MYPEAFEAGVWLQHDPGLFLACVVVYKLQSRLHWDKHDVGPSVLFPVGQFTGGEMVFPQLNMKLQWVIHYSTIQSLTHYRYAPGNFCIFYSSVIFHKVTLFIPLPQTIEQAADDITPGRIGSVFFFLKASLAILKGKPKGWDYTTAFGRNEGLLASMKRFKNTKAT